MRAPTLTAFYSLAPRLRAWIASAYVLIVLVALSAWLLDGFNIGPVNDGWINLGFKAEHVPLLRDAGAGRIFGSLPRAVGLRVVDGGFQGWQAALFALTCLRGLLFYAIIRRLLPAQPLFALACGLVALFNPADNSWFWLDATGAHFGFIVALAACLTTLIYQQDGGHNWLAGVWLLQAVGSLTYTAYLPLMAAFPVGVWLLRRVAGARGGLLRLLGCLVMVVVFLLVHLVMVLRGAGREGRVADLSLHAALGGYGHESVLLLRHAFGFLSGFRPEYLLLAVLIGLLAFWVALRAQGEAGGGSRPGWRSHAVLLAGFVGLAAMCYFPYAISDVRFGQKRQLMAAGIFLYAALLYLLLVLLPLRLPRPFLAAALGVFAALTVSTGLAKRSAFVEAYRAQERLLAGVAAAAPHPLPGTTILVWLRHPGHMKRLGGFYSRWWTFSSGLQAMYSDASLRAGFVTPRGMRTLQFRPEGVGVKGGGHRHVAMFAPYGRLLLVSYSRREQAALLDREWLQRQVPAGTDVSGYAPQRHRGARSDDAVICTMLEVHMRPGYCDEGDDAD
jgi:hypothetical protein